MISNAKYSIVGYAQWEMECCGDPFKIGDVVEWPVSKASVSIEKERPVIDGALGPIEYYYHTHASSEDEIYNLKATVTDIQAVYYVYKPSVKKPNVLVSVSGKAVTVKDAGVEYERNAPSAYYIKVEIISIIKQP